MSAQLKNLKMSSSIDTSHLKVKFPFKAKYGNFIGGKFFCILKIKSVVKFDINK